MSWRNISRARKISDRMEEILEKQQLAAEEDRKAADEAARADRRAEQKFLEDVKDILDGSGRKRS